MELAFFVLVRPSSFWLLSPIKLSKNIKNNCVIGIVLFSMTITGQVHLSDALLRSLMFHPASGGRGAEVAWLDGITTKRNRDLDAGGQGG